MTLPHPSQRRWWHRAECRDLPTELFYHEGLTEEARSVCFECPVRQACLFAAISEERDTADEDIAGMRGGLTAKDRVILRRIGMRTTDG